MAELKKVAVLHMVFNSVIKGGGEKLAIEMSNNLNADLIAGSIDLKSWGQTGSMDDCFGLKMWGGNLRLICLLRESRIPLWRRIKREVGLAVSPRIRCLNDYDVIVFSGDPLRVSRRLKGPKKIYYCNTPPRHLTDQKKAYLSRFPRMLRSILNYLLKKDLQRYIRDLGHMDVIITNSENTRQRLLTYTGFDSQVIFPAVDTSRYHFLGQKDYYLSYARLDEWKRIKLIVQAFQKMPEKKLVIASTGSLKKWVEREIKNYPNITYEGLVSDQRLAALIGNCLAGIYIPINEDAGMTPCELMAAGKPVIGVQEGGVRETVVDNQTGILIKADPRIDDVIAAVKRMTPQLAFEMKNRCRQQVKKFDQKNFYCRLRDIINKLTAEGSH